LLREDEEFRLLVMAYLGISDVQSALGRLVDAVGGLVRSQSVVMDVLSKILENIEKLWENQNKLWEEVKALRESQNKLWEENNKIWQEVKALRENQERLWQEVKALRENQDKTWKEIEKLWQELKTFREEQEKRWQENEKRWEEAYKRFEAIETELRNLREDFNKSIMAVNRRLDALGARWGLISEEAFREGMRGVVERILGVAKVEKWSYNDVNGEVYGHPAMIDVDIVVKDGSHILVEVKSSVSRGDVAEFWRIGRLYERVNGVKPRLVIVSPYVDDRAMELARELGIEVYTEVT